MSNPYTWTTNAMAITAEAKPSLANGNLQWLKYEVDALKQLNTDYPTLLTITTAAPNLTLDRIHKITPSAATTLVLPTTGMTSGIMYNCQLFVTMSVVYTLSYPSSVKWMNNTAPTMSSTTATYRLTFETINAGTQWNSYYTTIGA